MNTNGLLKHALPALNDAAGNAVPKGLLPVIDAHVHLFPHQLFKSIWRWFDNFGWPIRYRLPSETIIEFLLSRGISHIIGLHYAHKPGVADDLNVYMRSLCEKYPQVIGTATVFPGESRAVDILERAFRSGLKGVKLHAHVQCFEMTGTAMDEIYRVCVAHDHPLVIHAGREPKSDAYACDPYQLCGAAKVARVIERFPDLKLCVPHLGSDEYERFQHMLHQHDNLWLDTAMALADYLPSPVKVPPLDTFRIDRILFGTDFPNIPYAWDRELRKVAARGLSAECLEMLFHSNAAELFQIA